jgi:DNA-binding NarL/FixJ family response regulator
MSAFRILLADDHPIFRLGLRSVLDSHQGWEVCGEAVDGADAVAKCRQLRPDLAILNICLPGLNGLDGARQILNDNPAQGILILTEADSEEAVRDCLQAGARGWILKSDGICALTTAVQTLQQHSGIVCVRTPAALVRGRWKANPGAIVAKSPQLSPRQREILQLLAEGRGSKEVAGILKLSVKTVETHRNNLMHKLDLHSLAKLVVYAIRNALIRVDSQSVCNSDQTPERGSGTMEVLERRDWLSP